MDARIVPEELTPPAHVAIRREDYRPPDWLVPEIALDFALDPKATRVRATLEVVRNGAHDRPLRLDGDELAPLGVRVDGGEARWRMDGPALVIEIAGDRATIETEV
ncbi:MAG: aminopeptidase N, partial [Sphingomicrobium sp.]